MSQRAAAWLAWSSGLLAVLAAAVMLVLRYRNDRSTWVIAAFGSLVYLAFVTVGAFVVSRRPQNAIGWIFIAGALIAALGELALEFAVYSLLTAPGKLPGGAWAAWFGDWARVVGFTIIIGYVLLLFPDGRVPSQRWRMAVWLPISALAAYTLAAALAPAPKDFRLQSVSNLLGITDSQNVSGLLSLLFLLLWAASVIVGAAAAIDRFRRAQGDERRQIKWFAYAAVLGLCATIAAVATIALNLTNYAIGGILFPLAIAGLPLATGIAILKYRLYAIDLLIRRTLVYGLLTALLALVYFGSVVALQALFTAITPLGGAPAGAAGQQRSELVTVLSTLAIAALFVPLRQRVQAFIDRRFYRRKYDAARTLAQFSAALRDEVNLDDLSERLLVVVDETMQPESVGLWLIKR